MTQLRKQTAPMKPFAGGLDSGVSLIGLLVLIGVIGVMALGFMKNHSFNIQVQNLIRSKRSTQESKQGFESALISAIRTDSCVAPASVFNNTSVGGSGSFTYKTNVIPGVDLTKITPPATRIRISGAKNRCLAPRSSADDTYFCVEFSRTGTTPKGSFLAGGAAFAEVLWEHVNFQTGQPVTCAVANAAPATHGARLIYSIYWLTTSSEGNNWQVLDGAINVAKQ